MRLAQAVMAWHETSAADPCKEIGIKRVALHRYVDPKTGNSVTTGKVSSA